MADIHRPVVVTGRITRKWREAPQQAQNILAGEMLKGTPFANNDWNVSRAPPRVITLDSPNLLGTTLAPAVAEVPFSQGNWENPVKRIWSSVALEWYNSTILPPAVGDPLYQSDWQNPVLSRKVQQPESAENLYGTSLFIAPVIPFYQSDWQNPILRLSWRDGTWSQGPAQPELEVLPFNEKDWKNPVVRIIGPDLTWIQTRKLTKHAGPSRSHKEEKRRAIDWSVPFSVHREELVVVEQKIEEIKKEISQEKKQATSFNVYEANAALSRIDRLLEALELLLKQRLEIQEILDRKPIVAKSKKDIDWALKLEQAKKEEEEQNKEVIRKAVKKIAAELKVSKILAMLDKVDEMEELNEDDYEVVVVSKKLRRKKKQ